MCKGKYAKAINKAIFPGTQGGPLMHIIAAKAICFGEALKPEFKQVSGTGDQECESTCTGYDR